MCFDPPTSTSITQVETCDGVYGSFLSPRVDLSLVTPPQGPLSYEILPLAAGADLHTLTPAQLKFTDGLREATGDGRSSTLSVTPQDASLSAVTIIAVDQGS